MMLLAIAKNGLLKDDKRHYQLYKLIRCLDQPLYDKVSGWAKDFAAGGGTGGLEEVGRIVRQSPEYSAKTGTKVEEAPPKAAGGLVTGIGPNGIAITRPAPGEGLTSIGVGERIVPAGGGGGGSQTIVLELRGDLGRLIEAKAQDTIVKNMAASKYR